MTALAAQPGLAAELASRLGHLGHGLACIEADLDADGGCRSPADLERLAAALIEVKDRWWAASQDRLRTVRAVVDLAGPTVDPAAIGSYLAIQEALSGIDRLEVRGRDSAGLTVLVRGHGLDLSQPALLEELSARRDELFASGAIVPAEGCLSFVYKAAAEIGELGDNTRALRQAIEADGLLRRALVAPEAEVVVLGHTRWASVGIISAANAHPLNAEEQGRAAGPYVTAALNGDVDNFADLKATHGLSIRSEITTDAKVIPTLASRLLADGHPLLEAFRRSVAQMEGSVAIAAQAASRPDALLLALRGSGQALYVGLGEDVFVVASEPYGLVEVADRYLRMDGETPADPDNPTGSRGQVLLLDATQAGGTEGIRRWAYDGTETAVRPGELVGPQITTRDIDRGAFPHFLLKEISESPSSFRKTLRGRLTPGLDGRLTVRLGPESVPAEVEADLASGRITDVLVIGQGTAAVAGQAVALALAAAVPPETLRVESVLATELSGFRLRSDMSDTLVVAISQSGTTTDTNRTVDLVRSRGARVISIVNRRQSDLVDRSDGVLYTSDGRDVEMSVASTKAFYAQVAAGFLLAAALADRLANGPGGGRATERPPAGHDQELLAALAGLPALMERTLELRPQVADAARQLAPSRRYWALVGNGPNRIAAHEVRIKLSELCYKSIACDGTEDKKHIDLSSEPLILVCAAGLSGSTAEDVAKEVGIYRAHRAAPVVIASEGSADYPAALAVLRVPDTHPLLSFVLATMVGHLFGYESALAIDALALPLRQARAAVEAAVSTDERLDVRNRLRLGLEPVVGPFFDGLRAGNYNGQLEASTASRVASHAALRAGCAAPRRVPAGVRQGRHPGRGPRRPGPGADPGHRRADPAGRRHQAPGQDGDRRDLPVGREPDGDGAGEGGHGGRRRPGPAVLRRAAHAGGLVAHGGRGHRLHPLPDRGSGRRRRGQHHGGRPGRHRPRPAVAHRGEPPPAGDQAPGGHQASCAGGPGPLGRAPGRDRPGGEGRPDDRHHAASRTLRRAPAGFGAPHRAHRLRRSLRGVGGRGDRNRADLPGGSVGAGTGSRPAHRAGQRAGRPLAVLGVSVRKRSLRTEIYSCGLRPPVLSLRRPAKPGRRRSKGVPEPPPTRHPSARSSLVS